MEILDFYANWCGQCKKMMPIIDELSKEYTIRKIDVDSEFELAKKFNVSSLPAILIVEDDKVLASFTGIISKTTLLNKLNDLKNQ